MNDLEGVVENDEAWLFKNNIKITHEISIFNDARRLQNFLTNITQQSEDSGMILNTDKLEDIFCSSNLSLFV